MTTMREVFLSLVLLCALAVLVHGSDVVTHDLHPEERCGDEDHDRRPNNDSKSTASKKPPPPATRDESHSAKTSENATAANAASRSGLQLTAQHKVVQCGYDVSPVVVEKYKLLIFTIPKVGCTVLKQLARRMMGFSDWSRIDEATDFPHDPSTNGLWYLCHYPLERAQTLLTDPSWTRAMFVRDPKERLLSAYLDKAVGSNYVQRMCCWGEEGNCAQEAASSLGGFLDLIKWCSDPHWEAQAERVDADLWDYVDFLGHMESIHDDMKTLLKSIGAWEEMGSSGWGKDGKEEIFRSTGTIKHSRGAAQHTSQHYTPELEKAVEEWYAIDYNMNKLRLN